jgi:hypothetical protein
LNPFEFASYTALAAVFPPKEWPATITL